MSKVTAARIEESQSRAYDLHDEINTKLCQAKGICGLICEVGGNGGNEALAESASATEGLIEGVEKALEELWDIEHGRAPREGQE